MKTGAVISALFAVLLAVIPASTASLNVAWKATTLSVDDCVAHAQEVLQGAGLALQGGPHVISDNEKAVWATFGDTGIATIRCSPSNGLVVIAAAEDGDSSASTRKVVDDIQGAF